MVVKKEQKSIQNNKDIKEKARNRYQNLSEEQVPSVNKKIK